MKKRSDGRRGASEPKPSADALLKLIYAVVRRVPRGRVITYGQAAELAGIPRGHRVAARALRECPPHLPWQRVLGKKDARRAQISIGDPEHGALQRALLEAEGVSFDEHGFVSLRAFGWLPPDIHDPPARGARVQSKRTSRV